MPCLGGLASCSVPTAPPGRTPTHLVTSSIKQRVLPMRSRVRHARQWLIAGRRPRAHYLHVGKTAGTAVKQALAPFACSGEFWLLLHPHATTLRDVPVGDKYFFTVRDPIDRYVSAFYSRQRQGQPRYYSPWSDAEESAFGRFSSASSLAEAIYEDAEAEHAMRNIAHVRDSYWKWFIDESYLRSRRADLLFVARQEHMAADFASLCRRLGVSTTLSDDPVLVHKSPLTIDRRLSPRAVENLRRWYAPDYEFLALVSDIAPSGEGPEIL